MIEAPERIYWEVTRGCNLRCLHCRATPTELSSSDDLTTQQCYRIMDQIAQVCKPALVLTGGEPLLREDIYDLGEYGALKGFRMGLATNGTLITFETAYWLLNSGFRRVSVSLDGPDASTHDPFRKMPGAFETAVEGVRQLKEAGLYVQINTTVTTHNASRLEEILSLVARLSADAWHLFLLVPVGCGLQIAEEMQLQAKEYERVLNWIEDRASEAPFKIGPGAKDYGAHFDIRPICAPHGTRVRAQRSLIDRWLGRSPGGAAGRTPLRQTGRGCTAGSEICFISHRGKVYPCGYLPLEAGDLTTETFREVWSHSPVLSNLRDTSLLKGKCGECEFQHLCGGCRARAYGMSGDYLEAEPYCLYRPGTFTALGVDERQILSGLIDLPFSRAWTDEARVQLFYIPYALRHQVVEKVEHYAALHGIDPITPEAMNVARAEGEGKKPWQAS